VSKSESQIVQEFWSVLQLLQHGLLHHDLQPIPEIGLIFHVVNEGKRSLREGDKLKREGLRKGVSDYCFPIRSIDGRFGALLIEFKTSIGKPSKEQLEYIALLRRYGNRAEILYGDSAALRGVCCVLEHIGRLDALAYIQSIGDIRKLILP
jgi:hypothetical protein